MARIPLYYTFGNHMHWVDMEWLWGYHVLPGSIRDMLRFCAETGARGNVNFDGIGYEKLAAEDPEALADLKAAIHVGTVEPVGCSYGQPYGLFHGGESNIRQRIYGVRTVVRLFGVRPKTFWEEEFDFFPQLPQMLRGVGFNYASLFFQWTWHTPEIPREDAPVIWWEGQDGSRLLCATRNKLNLHQWPEDMDLTFAALASEGAAKDALILQWLELMPSPDWMCRSEVLLPKMKELLADDRFEIRMGTLGEYLGGVSSDVPVRRYSMDEVWHGMSLGKNGDYIRRLSRRCERDLLSAETLSAINGLFGRPYTQWDVYPTWELEEAWREVLSAQHHDNDECEGLCGSVGIRSYERSRQLAQDVLKRNVNRLAQELAPQGASIRRFGPTRNLEGDTTTLADSTTERPQVIVINPLGWEIQTAARLEGSPTEVTVVTVPAFGWSVVDTRVAPIENRQSFKQEAEVELERGDLQVSAALGEGRIRQIRCPQFREGVFGNNGAFRTRLIRNGSDIALKPPKIETYANAETRTMGFRKIFDGPDDVSLTASFHQVRDAIRLSVAGRIDRPDPGMNAGLQASIHLGFRPKLVVDQPYGVSEVVPTGKGLKKYPTGDWMTSPQWFEEVERPFTALSFVDLVDAGDPNRGLLIVHDGSQQWFMDEDEQTVRCLLTAYDPWDEDYFRTSIDANFILFPHGPITNAERWKIAQEFLRPASRAFFSGELSGSATFSALSCDAPNVIPTAFYRETEDYSGKGFENYAGKGVGYPYVVRLVEFDGVETEATLTVAGTVAKAFKTSLMGEIEEELGPDLKIKMRPYEIATVYLDIVEGRKQARDLDAKREIWATVHRVE